MNPNDLLYSREHEWVRIDGDKAEVGITSHAQRELGDIVFVEMPSIGDKFETDESFGTVESVKAVSELFMPMSGEVTAINQELEDAPELVNSDPYGQGWMVRIKLRDATLTGDLLSAESYSQFTDELEE